MLNHEQKIKKYYRFQSKIYNATRWIFLLNRKKAIRMLNVKQNEIVIDFACGTGLNIKHLLRHTRQISGIDFSEDMLDRAAKTYTDVNFIQADACFYHAVDKADKIICTYSLSIIEHWEEAIRNICKNLKADGTLVILDFHRWSGALKIFYPVFKWWLRRHGVNCEIAITTELQKYFSLVEVSLSFSGYSIIAKATGLR